MKKILLWLCLSIISCAPAAGQAEKENIMDLSIEELLDIKVSTASKYEQAMSEAPASVSVITSEDIEAYGYKTLQEILLSKPGFFSNNDRNYVFMGLRGFNRQGSYNTQIIMLLNGQEINDKVYGSPSFGFDLGLSPEIIDRIEIVRGPGSAMYGNGATFAVINIITKPGKKIDGIQLSGEYGSFDKKSVSILLGKEFSNDLSLSASAQFGDIKGEDLYFPEFDSPATNNGLARGLDWEKYQGLSAEGSYNDFSVQMYYFSREKGVPTAAWETIFNDPGFKTIDTRGLFQAKYSVRPTTASTLTARAYGNLYYCGGAYPIDAGEPGRSNYAQYDSTNSENFGAELMFFWDISPQNRISLGTEFQVITRADYNLWDTDTSIFYTNHPFNIISFNIQDYWQAFDDFSVSAGFRVDKYSDFDNAWVSPKVAAIYNLNNVTTLKAIIGESYRSPNIYERFYEDPLSALSNHGLKAEKITEFEFVVEHKISDFIFASASYYNYNYHGLIDQGLTADSMIQFSNLYSVIGNGIELEANARLGKDISSYLNYAFQSVNDNVSGERLSNSPEHIVKAGLSDRFFGLMTVSAEADIETSRYTLKRDSLERYETGPFVSANLYLLFKSYTKSGGFMNDLLNTINVSLQVRNLFDREYFLPGGYEHLQKAIRQDSRSVSLTLKLVL